MITFFWDMGQYYLQNNGVLCRIILCNNDQIETLSIDLPRADFIFYLHFSLHIYEGFSRTLYFMLPFTP